MNARCTCTMHKSIKKEYARNVLNVWIFPVFTFLFSLWQSIETVQLTFFYSNILNKPKIECECDVLDECWCFSTSALRFCHFLSVAARTRTIWIRCARLIRIWFFFFLKMKRLILTIRMQTTGPMKTNPSSFIDVVSFWAFRKFITIINSENEKKIAFLHTVELNSFRWFIQVERSKVVVLVISQNSPNRVNWLNDRKIIETMKWSWILRNSRELSPSRVFAVLIAFK